MGLLINVEAIDRAGKTTATALARAALDERGLRVASMAFPYRPSTSPGAPAEEMFPTGVLIDRYLHSQLILCDGRDSIFHLLDAALRETFDRPDFALDRDTKAHIAGVIEEKLAQVLFSVNRRERIMGPTGLLALLADNDVVFVQRYLSAYTYSIAQGVSRLQLSALESDLPQPDLTFLLDVDPAVARARRPDDEADRYEADAAFQARVRELYNELVRDDAADAAATGRPARFMRIDAALEPEAIAEQIRHEVMRRLEAAGQA